MLTLPRSLFLLTISLALSGCAVFHDHEKPTAEVINAQSKLPQQWQAPLPHNGKITDLKRWWDQFDDPLLSELISAAQNVSPTLATAKANIEQARATSVSKGATLLPSVTANASQTRGQSDVRFPKGTSTNYGLSMAWEIDLFGGESAASDAADARFAGARADWHAARTSVAAEVANSYINYRACEAELAQAEVDAKSRKETARLTDINHQAGFESPANAALARASAAQGNSQLTQQRALCDIQIKALVALTAIDEPALRQRLTAVPANIARIPQPAQINVGTIPGQTLAQRPDLYSAAQSVLAANADVTHMKAQRYPQISLNGSFGRAKFESPTSIMSGPVWSVGPLSISMPIFDGGTISANVSASRARYDEAVSQYAAKLRTAVREVEEALVNLQSSSERSNDARTALEGYELSFKATEIRQQNGLANLFELEDARRTLAKARSTLTDLQRDQVTAWISLYRALGGGWQLGDSPQLPDSAAKQPPEQTASATTAAAK